MVNPADNDNVEIHDKWSAISTAIATVVLKTGAEFAARQRTEWTAYVKFKIRDSAGIGVKAHDVLLITQEEVVQLW